MPVNEKQLRTLMANNDELHKETRECIKKALIELLQKTRFNDISMTDIINRSGVSRAGVYKNYKSKTEIMLDIYRVFLDDIISELTGSIYKNVEVVFTMGQKYEKEINTLIDAGLEHHLLDMMNECYEDVADPYYMSMWMGMIYNSLIKWIKTGMSDPLETTIARIREDLKLIAHAIETESVMYFKASTH